MFQFYQTLQMLTNFLSIIIEGIAFCHVYLALIQPPLHVFLTPEHVKKVLS